MPQPLMSRNPGHRPKRFLQIRSVLAREAGIGAESPGEHGQHNQDQASE
jgi:hypothetical protein